MRNYLILIIALALLTTYGCSSKSTATRTTGGNAGNSEADTGRSMAPGLAGGGPRDQVAKKEDDAKKASDDSKDADKESSSEDDEAEAEAQKAAEEKAAEEKAKKRSKRKRGRVPGQKREISRPMMSGGGAQTPDQPSRDRGNSDGDGASSDDAKDDDPEEETEEESKDRVLTLYDRAVKAFSNEHETEAFQFLYAYYLTDDNAFKEHPLGWFDGVKEPRIALRWGVGISYSDGGYDGKPPVIGEAVEEESRGRGNRNSGGFGGGGDLGGGGGGGMTVPGNSKRGRVPGQRRSNRNTGGQSGNSRSEPERSPRETLDYYTGEYGDQFVKRYEMRRSRQYYGSIMQAIAESVENGMDPEEEADSSANQRSQLPGGGDFGMMGGGATGPQNNRRSSRNRDSDDSDYEADPTSLAPGLMMVGVGNKSQLLNNARNLNLDLIVVFEVKVKHTERRNGDSSTKSNTRLMLYSVKTGEALDTGSKSLSNLAVASAREKGRDDPVELELDKVFAEMADKDYKSKELPSSLDSDIANKRYQYLLKKEYENPLPILIEIKFYQDSGFVTKNDYIAACEQLLGDTEAQDLIDGNLKQQERALEKYLPGKFEVDLESSNEESFR
ncbi:MAG: hypothetical protein GY743_18790 [Planctomycetaceae bacterium]|nr:hypothetical protein [Planctomycetaceae bacterium]